MSLAQTEKYYLPQPSLWPAIGSLALLVMAVGITVTNSASPRLGVVGASIHGTLAGTHDR